MRVFAAEEIESLLTPQHLIEALRQAFGSDPQCPARQLVAVPGDVDQRLLLMMPAFDHRGAGVVKLVTVFPGNAAHGLPTVQAAILMFSEAGEPVALLDGTIVTRLRTAAASALASSYLSREDSAHLVIIGTGALAPYMAAAHAVVRPIRRISVWGRAAEAQERTACAIRLKVDPGIAVSVCRSVQAAVASADIVTCVTTSATPVLAGSWLRQGAFVDLVGSFSPDKREADDEVMRRSRIFVDTREGAMAEAGDILDPLARGVISLRKIEADLTDLASGRHIGRVSSDEIVTFKSVGTAVEDLAAAQAILSLAHQKDALGRPPPG